MELRRRHGFGPLPSSSASHSGDGKKGAGKGKKAAVAQAEVDLVWFEGPVSTDVAGMQSALIDLWLLGYADDMMTSQGSTFGYVAHGRAGRSPLLVSKEAACFREMSSEPCMHVWSFLPLQRLLGAGREACYDKRTMSAWFSRAMCHPFDTEIISDFSAANPSIELAALL